MDSVVALSQAILRISENQMVLSIMIRELTDGVDLPVNCVNAQLLACYVDMLDKNHLLLLDALCQLNSQEVL